MLGSNKKRSALSFLNLDSEEKDLMLDIESFQISPSGVGMDQAWSKSLCTPRCGNAGTGNSFCCM